MKYPNRSSFFIGYACGVVPSVLMAIVLASGQSVPQEHGAEPVTLRQDSSQTEYFVTGDTSAAALWRRERDGTLTCISVNACRRNVPGSSYNSAQPTGVACK